MDDKPVMLMRDGSNYSDWSHSMSQFMFNDRRKLWDYVCGSVTEPDPGHENYIKLSEDWITSNAEILRLISQNLPELDASILKQLQSFKSGKEAWDYLAELYGQSTSAKKYQLETELYGQSILCRSSLPSVKQAISELAAEEMRLKPSIVSSQGQGKDTVKILSYNVWQKDLELQKRMEALGDLIQLHSPDVICFQEITPKIYQIFEQSNWWRAYRCSVSTEQAKRPCFCMQLSKLQVKFFEPIPFRKAGRKELCRAKIEVCRGKSLVVASSHLKSPDHARGRLWTKERITQAQQALNHLYLNDSPNVIFCGDMNWDEELDGPFPPSNGWVEEECVDRRASSEPRMWGNGWPPYGALWVPDGWGGAWLIPAPWKSEWTTYDALNGPIPPVDGFVEAGWVDAWSKLRPGESGWTYDTVSNQMLYGNCPLQKRLDRFACNLQDFKLKQIDMIGKEAIPGLSYYKETKVRNKIQTSELPVFPSDHYSLLLEVQIQ